MLDEGQPDLVLAFPGGSGTLDMMRRAIKAKILVIKGEWPASWWAAYGARIMHNRAVELGKDGRHLPLREEEAQSAQGLPPACSCGREEGHHEQD